MAILKYLHILFLIMATPALSSSNKLLKEKKAGNYDSEKLGFGLGFSFPSYGIGLGGSFGGDSGDSNGSPGQRRDDSGFNFDLGFDLGGGNGYGGGGNVGVARDRPNNCRCTCDRGGGISGKSNGKNEGNHPPSKTLNCRPMNCNGNDCGGYSKREDGSSPYWCKVTGKVVPFWCNVSGESSGKGLNCEAINCPKGANCGAQGARFVLDVPVWADRRIEPGHF